MTYDSKVFRYTVAAAVAVLLAIGTLVSLDPQVPEREVQGNADPSIPGRSDVDARRLGENAGRVSGACLGGGECPTANGLNFADRIIPAEEFVEEAAVEDPRQAEGRAGVETLPREGSETAERTE